MILKKNLRQSVKSADKPAPVWVKDAEGIAKAWGLKLYEQRKMMVKQLDAVRAAMKADGFPVKVKGKGYDRAAVMAFAMERVEMHQNCRTFLVTSRPQIAPMNADSNPVGKNQRSSVKSAEELPEQDQPAGDADLFEDVSPTELRRERFDFLQKLYLYPERHERKITGIEIKELKAERPELFAKETESAAGGADSENIEGGYRGVAGWIRNNYQGRLSRLPNHTDIANWSRGEYLPAGCRENFPASEANNSRYKTAHVVAWVEKYIIKAETGQALPLTGLDDRQRKEKADADMAEMAADAERKRTSGLYVLTATAARTGTAIGIALRTLTREALEREITKRFGAKMEDGRWQIAPEHVAALKELLLADCVAVFTDWQRRAQSRLDELVEQCQPDPET